MLGCFRYLDKRFDELESHLEEIRSCGGVTNVHEVIGVKNEGETKLFSETFPEPQKVSAEERSNCRSENLVYCEHILHNIRTALDNTLHCRQCKNNLNATAAAFKRIVKYKKPSPENQPINLEDCDTSVLSSLDFSTPNDYQTHSYMGTALSARNYWTSLEEEPKVVMIALI